MNNMIEMIEPNTIKAFSIEQSQLSEKNRHLFESHKMPCSAIVLFVSYLLPFQTFVN